MGSMNYLLNRPLLIPDFIEILYDCSPFHTRYFPYDGQNGI